MDDLFLVHRAVGTLGRRGGGRCVDGRHDSLLFRGNGRIAAFGKGRSANLAPPAPKVPTLLRRGVDRRWSAPMLRVWDAATHRPPRGRPAALVRASFSGRVLGLRGGPRGDPRGEDGGGGDGDEGAEKQRRGLTGVEETSLGAERRGGDGHPELCGGERGDRERLAQQHRHAMDEKRDDAERDPQRDRLGVDDEFAGSSEAPSQTKKIGENNPSVSAKTCLPTRRGCPTAETARPAANPASIPERENSPARAARPNTIARTLRSSIARPRSSETRCTRRRQPLSSNRSSTHHARTAAPSTASAPRPARPAREGSTASGSSTMQAVSAKAI